MAKVRPPLCFTYGNLVFGRDLRDAWACFRLNTHSFEGRSLERQIGMFENWRAMVDAIGADVQIVRLATAWDSAEWVEHIESRTAPGREALARRRIEETLPALEHVGGAVPQVFMAVRLAAPSQDISAHLSKVFERPVREWVDEAKRALAWRDRRMFAGAALEKYRTAGDAVLETLAEYLPGVRPARSAEIQWWVRRQFTRGLGEPEVDGLHEPGALIFETNGQAVLQPLEGDVLRWMDSYVTPGARGLQVTSEMGESHQAMLVLGALPEYVMFPSRRLQLMFSPVEALPFPVDLTLNYRYIPNELAIRQTRRRIQDADEIARAEAVGDQGASEQALSRTDSVRMLLSYLQSSSRPPLLLGSVSIAVGADSAEERREKIAYCRRQWGPEVKLHQPLGDQLGVFCQHFPGQPSRALGYDAIFTTEQIAALMPAATHKAGAKQGFYRGYTLTATRHPVRTDLSEGSARNSATGIVITGSPGKGKTQLVQDLMYEGFLQGARIVDIEAKGDHRFHLLEEVAPHAESIELRPEPRLRGLVDPLRVAPVEMRQDVTMAFLVGLLPDNAAAAWQTAIHRTVAAVVTAEREPTCSHVITALKQGTRVEVQVGEALETYAQHGLTQLGFADPHHALPEFGAAQVTYIPIRHLPGASVSVARGDRTRDERIGDQILRLVALFAMNLLARDPGRLKEFAFDEAERMLNDETGRRLIATLERMGRSESAVPILSTQLISDVMTDQEEMGNLIGEYYAFGVLDEASARRALRMLGKDPDSAIERERMVALAEEGNEGRCYHRDRDGNVELIQVWIPPSQLRRTDTNPTRRTDAGRADAVAA